MPRMAALYVCLAVACIALASCAQVPIYSESPYSFAEPPPDYSPDYVYVPVVATDQPCCVQRWVLVPRACLVADPTEPPRLGPRLPPGCANAFNLLRMAERKTDLLNGRRLGAAPAAPSVRAAQQYIYGATGPLGGGLAATPGAVPPGSQEDAEKPASSGPLQQYRTAPPNGPATGSSSQR